MSRVESSGPLHQSSQPARVFASKPQERASTGLHSDEMMESPSMHLALKCLELKVRSTPPEFSTCKGLCIQTSGEGIHGLHSDEMMGISTASCVEMSRVESSGPLHQSSQPARVFASKPQEEASTGLHSDEMMGISTESCVEMSRVESSCPLHQSSQLARVFASKPQERASTGLHSDEMMGIFTASCVEMSRAESPGPLHESSQPARVFAFKPQERASTGLLPSDEMMGISKA
ncbi:hypothetical protein TNIN_327881 [Trichonephila inaurata madagascariensis]|uniref:Uncharacterized protein n=1 Tax=Trichonephila inaurata madagascariensis TaxID=2747483 RepID=A0A8X6KNR0_9ARAC|nr:hypothetical protein TNIN_327881 [Trichonephila inaurata madagascariensis]